MVDIKRVEKGLEVVDKITWNLMNKKEIGVNKVGDVYYLNLLKPNISQWELRIKSRKYTPL